ncbi:MAG: carbohydrate-binding protein [Chloroflexota bacterium]
MEDFRCGGDGVAFSDSGGGPGTGSYRNDAGSEGPDLENTSDNGGGVNVGWTISGEWIEYEIIAPSTDSYSFVIRYASTNGNNPQLQIRTTSVENGLQQNTGTISVGTTGGWQNWASHTAVVTLFQGKNIVRFNITNGNGNYNYFDIQPFTPTATPTPVTPTATFTPLPTATFTPVPPTATSTATPPPSLEQYIEAESGIGLDNWSIGTSGSASGGEYIYWSGGNSNNNPNSNNQVTYSFNAPTTGLYRVYLRANTNNNSGDDSMWVTIDGVTVTQSQNISRSDGWVKFNNIAGSSGWLWDQVHNSDRSDNLVEFYLTAGPQTLRLTYRENNTRIDQIFITNTSSTP